MLKQYVNVYMQIPEESVDFAMSVLMDFKFTGIVENYDELVITFLRSDWNDELKANLQKKLEDIGINVKIFKEETIDDKNWNEEWEANLAPIVVNERITITPLWKADDIQSPLKIIINPKMSFGTGEHATTRLVCRLLENTVQPGTFWIDAGTGTGVLAIAAIKLGAESVFAFDNNEWSIANAQENFDLNGVADNIELQELDIDIATLPEADGIAANLFTHLVVSALPKFHESLKAKKGILVCSGILKYDKDLVLNKALEAGFNKINELVEDEWIAFHFEAV